MKRALDLFLSLFIRPIKILVFIECFILNRLTLRGDGLFLRFWLLCQNIKCGRRFYSYYPFYLYQRGNLVMGDYCSFGEFTRIWNFGKIIIGNDFMAAPGLTILTGGHDPDTLIPTTKSIIIGNRVWCGANVTIMPGVTIGDDVVIGAGTLVNKDLPNESVAVGVPCRIINKVDMDKRNKFFHSRRNIENKPT